MTRKILLITSVFLFMTQLHAAFWDKFKPREKASSYLPYSTPVLEHRGYTVAYDGRTKTAIWVYEVLTKDSIEGDTKRETCSFGRDPNIPKKIQPANDDYTNSGFDRGHLAPFANHKLTQQEAVETYYLSNISPQHPQFNQEYWAKLEKYVRDLTGQYDRVRVVTGPLFLPEGPPGARVVTYQVIGKNDVAVPTHFFKVIRVEKGRTKMQRAYILPNKKIPKETSLTEFEVSVSKVEKVSGIIFR